MNRIPPGSTQQLAAATDASAALASLLAGIEKQQQGGSYAKPPAINGLSRAPSFKS